MTNSGIFLSGTARHTFESADGMLVMERGLPERIAESLFNQRVGTQFKKQNHVTLVFLAQLSMMVVKRRRCTFSRR